MAEIYQHMKPNERILYWAKSRRDEIRKSIAALQTEDQMLVDIVDRVQPLVCPYCDGEGRVMRPIPGCEIDGPRSHKCDACNGTGKPPQSDAARDTPR